MPFVEIEPQRENAMERAVTRALLQFHHSPIFLQVLGAFAAEVEELLTAIYEVVKMRAPASATGEALDVLGRIVGQVKVLTNFDEFDWFTPDTTYKGPDQAPLWVLHAPEGQSLIMEGAEYRNMIDGKVVRNHTHYGSVPEIQDFILRSFGLQSSIITVAPMEVKIVVEDFASNNTISFLSRKGDTRVAESVYVLPIAAGVKIAQVVRFSAQ